MRWWAAVGVVALGGLAAGCTEEPRSGADVVCAAPSITVEPTTVPPGGGLTVRGTGFVTGCADASSVGDDGTATAVEESVPLRDLEVLWSQHGTEVTLAEVDADASSGFTVEVRVPPMVEPGPASITVDPAEPVRITVSPSWTEPPRRDGG